MFYVNILINTLTLVPDTVFFMPLGSEQLYYPKNYINSDWCLIQPKSYSEW